MQKTNNKATMKRVLKYIRKYTPALVLSLLLAGLTVLLTLYIPILTGNAVDLIIGKGQVDMPGIFAIMKKIAIVMIITAVGQWVMNTCNNYITYHVIRDIRTDAFAKLEILPLKYLDAHAYGDIVSRVIADVDTFADGLLMGFTQLFTGVLTILCTLGFMLVTNVPITLVVVCITPVSFLVAKFIATKTYSMFKEQSETRGEQTSLIEEMIDNQKIVNTFSRGEAVKSKFGEINGRLQKCSLKAIFFSSITNPATRFVNSLVYAGVGVFGALVAIKGGISVGRLSCFLSYANQYTKPFNEISGVVTELQNAFVCAGRIFELIDEEPQVPDAADARVLEDAQGNVDLKNVYFQYVPEKKLIQNFNLSQDQYQIEYTIYSDTGLTDTQPTDLLRTQIMAGQSPDLYRTDWRGEIKQVSEADAEQFYTLLDSIAILEGLDAPLSEILSEEADAYFAGGCTAEQAAKNIQSRASLYLQEKYQ